MGCETSQDEDRDPAEEARIALSPLISVLVQVGKRCLKFDLVSDSHPGAAAWCWRCKTRCALPGHTSCALLLSTPLLLPWSHTKCLHVSLAAARNGNREDLATTDCPQVFCACGLCHDDQTVPYRQGNSHGDSTFRGRIAVAGGESCMHQGGLDVDHVVCRMNEFKSSW